MIESGINHVSLSSGNGMFSFGQPLRGGEEPAVFVFEDNGFFTGHAMTFIMYCITTAYNKW